MELLKAHLRKEIMVLISNDAMRPPAVGDVHGIGVHEIHGKLTAIDDGHPALEIETDEGSIVIVNWHQVVSVEVVT